MPPVFVEIAEVVEIHRDQIDRYGGSLGLRDMGLLESALAMPRAGFSGEYFHSDIYAMAAAYLFHIVKNHPFVDGNKRTGAATSLVFLEVNAAPVQMTNDELVELVLSAAQGRLQKDEVATFFRKHAKVRKLPSRRRRA